MHYSLYVVLLKEQAKDAGEAESWAVNHLEDNGFASSNQQYSSGYADWFEAGGRWAGDLQYWLLISKGLNKEKLAEYLKFLGGDKIPTKKTNEQKEWVRLFGKDVPHVPGEEFKSSTVLSTKKLIQTMHAAGMLHADIGSGGAMTSEFDQIEIEDMLKADDGEYWMVVIDYHN